MKSGFFGDDELGIELGGLVFGGSFGCRRS